LRPAAPTEARTVGSGAASVPETLQDAQEKLGRTAHHARKKHGRRFARWRSRLPHGGLFGFFAGR